MDALTCPILFEQYEETGEFQPRFLPACGHTLSTKAICSLLIAAETKTVQRPLHGRPNNRQPPIKCPTCNVEQPRVQGFEDCPPNWSVIGQVASQPKTERLSDTLQDINFTVPIQKASGTVCQSEPQPTPESAAQHPQAHRGATSHTAQAWDDEDLQQGGWVLVVRQRCVSDAECHAHCRLLITFSTAYLVTLKSNQSPLYKWLMCVSRKTSRRDSSGRLKMGPVIDTMKKANAHTIQQTFEALRWCRYITSPETLQRYVHAVTQAQLARAPYACHSSVNNTGASLASPESAPSEHSPLPLFRRIENMAPVAEMMQCLQSEQPSALDISDCERDLPLAPDLLVPPSLSTQQHIHTMHDAVARMHKLRTLTANEESAQRITAMVLEDPGQNPLHTVYYDGREYQISRRGMHECIYARRATLDAWVQDVKPAVPPTLQCRDYLHGRGGHVWGRLVGLASEDGGVALRGILAKELQAC